MRAGRRVAVGVLAAVVVLAGLQGEALANDQAAGRVPGSISKERIELFIALLKRRALKALEAHRAPPPPFLTASSGIAQGYESNVNLDGSRRGDFFTQETAGVTLNPRLTSWLSGAFTYDLLHTHYVELRDANLLMNTLGGAIQLQPHSRVRVDLAYEYSLVDFPFNTADSFLDRRTGVEVLSALTHWLTHQAGWTYQLRDYDTRKARDGAGNDLPGTDREDERHIVSQELRARFPKTSARIGGQYYRNVSNDLFQDFYDWEDYQVRGVVSQVLSPKWVGIVVASSERRNYQQRSVPAINVGERDTLTTLAGSLIYLINDHAQLTYSLTYRHQDSNDPRLDFIDWINQLRVSLDL